jgi:stage V sporulation protein AE
MGRKKVIIVTDGDRTAQAVVEKAASSVGGRTISASGGNPTPLSGEELAELILQAPNEPVLVMVDDSGKREKGPGERALETLAKDDRLEILGVIAVASNTTEVEGVPVDFSVARNQRVVPGPVDKDGIPETEGHAKVEGDTVDIINQLNIPIIVGIGDLGKMDEADRFEDGARVTTKAIQEIMERSKALH